MQKKIYAIDTKTNVETLVETVSRKHGETVPEFEARVNRKVERYTYADEDDGVVYEAR